MRRFRHFSRETFSCIFVFLFTLSFSILWHQTAHSLTAAVGKPSRGSLRGAVAFPDQFRGYTLGRPEHSYATPELIGAVLDAIEGVRKEHPNTCDIYLGDFSRRTGGRLTTHRSHQNGRDVDIGMYAKGNKPLRSFVSMSRSNMDVAKTWCLIENLLKSQRVQYIFLDRRLQKPLFDHALSRGLDREYLDKLFREVGTRHRRAVIRHLCGHRNHMHVRFITPWSTLAGEMKNLDENKRAAIELAQQAYLPKKVNYYVKGNEGSLKELARNFGVSARDLVRWNGLSPHKVPTPGSCLVFYKRGFELEPVRLAQSLDTKASLPIKLASFKPPRHLVSKSPKSKSSGAAPDQNKRSSKGEITSSKTSTYTVRPGDTLSEIAAATGVSTNRLASFNGIGSGTVLRVGQKLALPDGESIDLGELKTEASRQAKTAARKAQGEGREKASEWGHSYTVQAGDTLLGIAVQHKVKMDELCRFNGLDSKAVIHPGQKLKVPSRVAKPSSAHTYTVQKGDTLLGIAVQNRMSMDVLLKLNDIARTATLKPGQKLKVISGGSAPRSAEGPQSNSSEVVLYTVQKGDTLWALARKTQTTTAAIEKLNGFSAGDVLRPDMKIKLPAKKQ